MGKATQGERVFITWSMTNIWFYSLRKGFRSCCPVSRDISVYSHVDHTHIQKANHLGASSANLFVVLSSCLQTGNVINGHFMQLPWCLGQGLCIFVWNWVACSRDQQMQKKALKFTTCIPAQSDQGRLYKLLTGIYPQCILLHYVIIKPKSWCTGTLLNRIITAQWEGMGDVGSARYKPALLLSFLAIKVLSYSNC